MKVAIFGLGYVGLVTAICLADHGLEVIGIEIHPEKVEALKNKQLYLFETGLKEKFERVINQQFFPILCSEVQELPENIIVCVGTPSLAGGEPDLSYIISTMTQIADLIERKKGNYNVILRSTVPPGTTENKIAPLFEKAKDKLGINVAFHSYPEFLREGSAVKDFESPHQNVWGTSELEMPEIAEAICMGLRPDKVKIRTAEMIKFFNNSFHALKVTFVNEISTFGHAVGVDLDELVRVFLTDTKLNISGAYLHPGFAFGGPCLTKEVKSLKSLIASEGLSSPLIDAILPSNDLMIKRLIGKLETLRPSSVGLLGLTFKPGTDDLRNSPIIEVAKHFENTPSYSYRPQFNYFDSIVNSKNSLLSSINKVTSFNELLEKSQVVILGSQEANLSEQDMLLKSEKAVIDLLFFKYPRLIKTNLTTYSNVFER